jgi:hypothetical protein
MERDPLAVLPLQLAMVVLSLLPADQRLRCAGVCRGWRAVATTAELWARLDLSARSGLARPCSDALLRAAAGKARGAMVALDVSGCERVSLGALRAALAANAGALREVHACGVRTGADGYAEALGLAGVHLAPLLAAAPFAALHAHVRGSAADVRLMLRGAEAYGLLRARAVRVRLMRGDDVAALAADAAAHAHLQELTLEGAAVPGAELDAVADAALALRLRTLRLLNCPLLLAAGPPLARLLAGDALTELHISGPGFFAARMGMPGAVLLAGALRDNTTLRRLTLLHVTRWADEAAGEALLAALTGHPSLCALDVSWGRPQERAQPLAAEPWDDDDDYLAARQPSEALAALLVADAPALRELRLALMELGDEATRPLLGALSRNTQLETLDLRGNRLSEAFVRWELLSAVRANSGLRTLLVGDAAAEREAEDVVAARAAAAL